MQASYSPVVVTSGRGVFYYVQRILRATASDVNAHISASHSLTTVRSSPLGHGTFRVHSV
jgi:hypothetical protein